MILGVIPGWCAAPDPESRDSGFDASHRPGMTVLEALFCWLHFQPDSDGPFFWHLVDGRADGCLQNPSAAPAR